jgi:hypothetical protein
LCAWRYATILQVIQDAQAVLGVVKLRERDEEREEMRGVEPVCGAGDGR